MPVRKPASARRFAVSSVFLLVAAFSFSAACRFAFRRRAGRFGGGRADRASGRRAHALAIAGPWAIVGADTSWLARIRIAARRHHTERRAGLAGPRRPTELAVVVVAIGLVFIIVIGILVALLPVAHPAT